MLVQRSLRRRKVVTQAAGMRAEAQDLLVAGTLLAITPVEVEVVMVVVIGQMAIMRLLPLLPGEDAACGNEMDQRCMQNGGCLIGF